MNTTATEKFDSAKRSIPIHSPIDEDNQPLQIIDKKREAGGSQHQKEKLSFISAELAFSSEQKRLFDKIGYNKQLSLAKQRENFILKSINTANNSQLNKNQRRNIGAVTQIPLDINKSEQYRVLKNQENQIDFNLSQPQIIKGLQSLALEEEGKFMRRQGKADETFYENRVSSLSKTRTQRQLLFEEAMSKKRSSSGSANVMKRLMIMRKIKDNSEFNEKVSNAQPDNNFETLNHEDEDLKEYQNQGKKQLNIVFSPTQRDRSNKRNEMLKSNGSMELSEKRRDGSSQSCTNQCNTLNRIGQFNQNFMSRKTNADFQQSMTTPEPYTDNSAALTSKTFTYVKILPDKNKQSSSTDSRQPHMNMKNHEIYEENFFNPSDENIYHELDAQSVISSGSMFHRLQVLSSAHATRKLQSNRVVNNMNALQFVPHVKGVSKQHMVDLFNAKCQDLKIVSSKDQMTRFFETFIRNQGLKERRLNLCDSGIGDYSIQVVCSILKNNPQFAQLDLHKNSITNDGIKFLANTLMKNSTLVHLDIGCNQFSSDGACALFYSLFNHQSLSSIRLGNSDCYKNKNKIGVKGAGVLGELIARNHLIQFVDLSDSNLSAESLSHIIHGVKLNPQMVSLNLSQNDLGQGISPYTPFNGLMCIFEQNQKQPEYVKCQAIEELILSNTNLNNKQMEEFGQLMKKSAKTKLSRLDLSFNNKITTKGILSLFLALRANLQTKITHLTLDKTNLSMGLQQEQINNFFDLLRVVAEYLRVGKSLRLLSLNGCQVSNDLMNAIGKGLAMNDNLEYLSLKQNQISSIGLQDVIIALTDNANLKLSYLDLSSNRIDDQAGLALANALSNLNSLEQLFLRDNEMGVEAGDALYFLVQQKKNLWKVQLEKNAIRYGTLMEIDKECKRNRRNFYLGKQGHYQGIKQEISELNSSQFPYSQLNDLTYKISNQDQIIKQGQNYIHRQEEKVHQLLTSDQDLTLQLLSQHVKLLAELESLEEQKTQIDHQYINREKEMQRKIDFEQSLVERQRDYMEQELRLKVNEERKRVNEKRVHRRVDEEVEKMKKELEKVQREAQLMAMIADNYQKEISRRKASAALEAVGNDDATQRNGVQSANMVLFFTKKIHQMVTEDKIGEKDVLIESDKLKKFSDANKTPKLVIQKKYGRTQRSGDRLLKNGSKKMNKEQKVKHIASLKDRQTKEQTD